MEKKDANTRVRTFSSTKEDDELAERIMRFQSKTNGKPSLTTAIRYALRKGVKGLPK